MKNKELKKIVYTTLIFLFAIQLNAQINMPQINIKIENATAIATLVEKIKVIEDSIDLVEYSQILDNDLMFSFIQVKDPNSTSKLNRLIEIELEGINNFLKSAHSKVYLMENDSTKSIQIAEMSLPNGKSYTGSYMRKFNSNILKVFMIEQDEQKIKQNIKYCESINIDTIE